MSKEETKPAWMSLRSECHNAPIMCTEAGDGTYCSECGHLCETVKEMIPTPSIEQVFREKVLKVVNDAANLGELKISSKIFE